MFNKEILMDYFADISDMDMCEVIIDENLFFKYKNIEYKSLKSVYEKFKKFDLEDIILDKYQKIFIKVKELTSNKWFILNNKIFSISNILKIDNVDIIDTKISIDKSLIIIYIYYEQFIINDSKNLFTKINTFNKFFENKFAIGYNKKGELVFMNNFHISLKPFINPKKDIDSIKNKVKSFLNERFIYDSDNIFNRYSTILEPINKSDFKYIKNEITQI